MHFLSPDSSNAVVVTSETSVPSATKFLTVPSSGMYATQDLYHPTPSMSDNKSSVLSDDAQQLRDFLSSIPNFQFSIRKPLSTQTAGGATQCQAPALVSPRPPRLPDRIYTFTQELVLQDTYRRDRYVSLPQRDHLVSTLGLNDGDVRVCAPLTCIFVYQLIICG